MRDRFAEFLCNIILNTVATKRYRNKLHLIIQQGMMHAELGGPFIVREDEHKDFQV